MQKILRRTEVEAITGLSRSSIYAQMANGNFPKPINIGERAVGWIAEEITAWIESKLANRSVS